MNLWRIIDVGTNMGGLNEAEMRDSYLEREVPTSVEEDQDDDVNGPDILEFTYDDIEF
jgi:hypothetical protein